MTELRREVGKWVGLLIRCVSVCMCVCCCCCWGGAVLAYARVSVSADDGWRLLIDEV